MGILSQELSFQLNNPHVRKCQRSASFNVKTKGFMQKKLPMDNSKKNFTTVVMLGNVRAKINSKNYVKGNSMPDVSNTDYRTLNSIDTLNWFTGDKAKLQMYAVGDDQGRVRIGPQMGYGTNLQGHENDFSGLKLGKNMLNFFHGSHKLRQASVDTSKVDEFEGMIIVGTILLKEGEQGLDGRLEVGVASRMLKEAAVRFAAASAINPSSVAAVDAWGTTLLAHGKLKLLLSEKLRDMLLEARAPHKKLDDPQGTMSSLEDLIPNVCEECENLLVEAGRKFGKAVSLDKSNDFALYNWGLALFYRARLIAADGLKDAVEDAEDIYLAAIDKFKATVQLSKDYSGAAYLSWSLALRDRYWLHGLSSKADIQMLEQATWASEQAMRAYPNGFEAKLILQACMEELASC